MTTNSKSEARASQLLTDLWLNGSLIAELPENLRPVSRKDGYAIQALLEDRMGPPYGWKIAATSIAGQMHIGVEGPIAGRIFDARVVPNGGVVPASANQMSVAEVEFAFRMKRDLPPRDTAYSVDEVMDAVDTLHAAIEIPNTRYSDVTRVGAPQLIADNACAHYFVAADAARSDWRSIDLAAYPIIGGVNGNPVAKGVGRNALGDPRLALTWIANELSSLGITLKAEQMVTTGTCVDPFPIAAGDVVTADLGDLGLATVTIG